MIHYENGQMTMECDDCGSSDCYDGSWKDCLDDAKNNDWISIKDEKDGWLNFCCYECKEEYFKGE